MAPVGVSRTKIPPYPPATASRGVPAPMSWRISNDRLWPATWCPRAGAMPIQATQGRLHRPAPTDLAAGIYCREYQLTAPAGGRTGQAHGSACRQPDGSWRVSNQHHACPWRPARRSNGGDQFNCPCRVQPFRPHPVPLRRPEPELEPKAGEGGCRRACPRPVPHSRNPGDRYARPRTRYL